MKQLFFPKTTDPGSAGLVVSFPDAFAATVNAITDLYKLASLPCYAFTHGKGIEAGNGSLPDLQRMVNRAIFQQAYKVIDASPYPTAPASEYGFVFVQVQTNNGYTTGEIQFMEKFIMDNIKPKYLPIAHGYSWGSYGWHDQVRQGKINPANYSSMHLVSGGQNVNWVADFAAKMKGVNTPVYYYHNENDTIAPVSQSRLFYDALKAQGNKVGKVIFKNVWTSSDGTQTSHGTLTFLWQSNEWTVYSTELATSGSTKYTVEVDNVNKYFFKGILETLKLAPVAAPDPKDQKIADLEAKVAALTADVSAKDAIIADQKSKLDANVVLLSQKDAIIADQKKTLDANAVVIAEQLTNLDANALAIIKCNELITAMKVGYRAITDTAKQFL